VKECACEGEGEGEGGRDTWPAKAAILNGLFFILDFFFCASRLEFVVVWYVLKKLKKLSPMVLFK